MWVHNQCRLLHNSVSYHMQLIHACSGRRVGSGDGGGALGHLILPFIPQSIHWPSQHTVRSVWHTPMLGLFSWMLQQASPFHPQAVTLDACAAATASRATHLDIICTQHAQFTSGTHAVSEHLNNT